MQKLQEPEGIGCGDDHCRVDPTEPRDPVEHIAWVRHVLDDGPGKDDLEASVDLELLELRDVAADISNPSVMVFRKPAPHLFEPVRIDLDTPNAPRDPDDPPVKTGTRAPGQVLPGAAKV